MRKKICTLFLLLVLAVQVLPVQQMGRLLFSNQFTEEVPHSIDIEKDGFKKLTVKVDYLAATPFTLTSAFINFRFQHLHFADAVPQNHTGEIHVPPPNC